jgi:hypothetical protein
MGQDRFAAVASGVSHLGLRQQQGALQEINALRRIHARRI